MSEIEQNWKHYPTYIKGKIASCRLNMALVKIAPIENLSYRFFISVKFLNPNTHGFPSQEEFQTVYDIEDTISEVLEEENGAVFAGAVENNGRLDLFFYSQKIENYEQIICNVMCNFPEYVYEVDFQKDSQWESYLKFLYPENPKCIR